MLPAACGRGHGPRLLDGMKREPFVEPVPWWYRLVMDAGVVILGLEWYLLIPYFAFAQWRDRRRLAAQGYRPERYLKSDPGG